MTKSVLSSDLSSDSGVDDGPMIITGNKTLIELDLSNNLFGGRDIAHIERGLRGHSFIHLRDVFGNKYSSADYD